MAKQSYLKNWQELDHLLSSDLMQNITDFLDKEYQTKTIFPPKYKIFTAFDLCSFANTKVVILGQDPYHNESQANGLAFAVNKSQKAPPSLENIKKEIYSDTELIASNDLIDLAKQGVLLLNSVLTVEKNAPNSHAHIGWQEFSDEVISVLSEQKQHLVFLLWGANAIKKQQLIDNSKHLILTAPHPSPLSAYRGFFGCKHFSKTNDYLQKNNIQPIHWGV